MKRGGDQMFVAVEAELCCAGDRAREVIAVRLVSVLLRAVRARGEGEGFFDTRVRVAAGQHALEPFLGDADQAHRSEEHTSELQSPCKLVCRLLLDKKKRQYMIF